jgi:hypothetical protein
MFHGRGANLGTCVRPDRLPTNQALNGMPCAAMLPGIGVTPQIFSGIADPVLTLCCSELQIVAAKELKYRFYFNVVGAQGFEPWTR